jgi:hypothetical protein
VTELRKVSEDSVYVITMFLSNVNKRCANTLLTTLRFNKSDMWDTTMVCLFVCTLFEDICWVFL